MLYDSNQEGMRAATLSQASMISPAGTGQAVAISDYEEFEAYRQWLQWKKSAVGTPEYEEFQQWREWRKYKEWEIQK